MNEEKNDYGLRRTVIGDMLVLMKNNKPVLSIPDELEEDFIQLIVGYKLAERLQNGGISEIIDKTFDELKTKK